MTNGNQIRTRWQNQGIQKPSGTRESVLYTGIPITSSITDSDIPQQAVLSQSSGQLYLTPDQSSAIFNTPSYFCVWELSSFVALSLSLSLSRSDLFLLGLSTLSGFNQRARPSRYVVRLWDSRKSPSGRIAIWLWASETIHFDLDRRVDWHNWIIKLRSHLTVTDVVDRSEGWPLLTVVGRS